MSSGRYRVTTQFQPHGPETAGYWDDPEVAESKFLAQVGFYGSGHAVIRLAEKSHGRYVVVKSWSQRTGVVMGDAT
ncbi:hypothetical protein [Streptomyces sp. NPDC001205]